jgi:acetyl-CoA acyltransferase 1
MNMPSDSEPAARRPNGLTVPDEDRHSVVDDPSTPLDHEVGPPPSSQITLPSTEGPPSPVGPNDSFKTEINDERPGSATAVIPSSLTPPPSSQVPTHNGNNGLLQPSYVATQRTALFSPPATTSSMLRREAGAASEYVPPAPNQVLEASADELRAMMQACIAEQAKLKMESAHHRLQYSLLELQSEEDAKRAAVEHEMTRREVEALRVAEHGRQARRELSTATESAHAKYLELKMCYESVLEENETLSRKLKVAKKLIQQKEEEVINLADEREMLLNRIRENREHFKTLCSPGGIFYGALTPKQQTHSTPQQQHRSTPKQTPRASTHQSSRGGDRDQERIAALLHVLSQDNNSAPSTPTTATRLPPRIPAKHTRNVQSLSSLPTTPTSRPRGGHAGLLPSVDLVPQTEPVHRYATKHFIPGTPTPTRERNRKSRESTISADDNEELARQALESVAAASASFLSRTSMGSRGSRRHEEDEEEEEEVFESQASQAASEMLRRDPRESFEVASSVGSRDGTPAPVEKSAKLQAKLFASVGKSGGDKRKFSGSAAAADPRRDMLASPSKKVRIGAPLVDAPLGLGIQYSQ